VTPSVRPSGAPPRLTRTVVEERVLGVLRWVAIAFFLIATIFPFLYMVMLSTRTLERVARDPAVLIPPLEQLTLDAYPEVLRSVSEGGQGFVIFIVNSAIVAIASVVISIGLAVPGAYAITRLRFAGRRSMSVLFLSIYLFPAILLAIPLFVLFSQLGLRGNLVGLLLVYGATAIPITIHMLRSYFETIPESLEEAAQVEGCGRLGVIRHITLPLATPAILSTSLFVFMVAWNEFLFALLFLVDRRERWTISLGLSQLAGSIEVPTTVLMAGAVILTLPIVILFFATERFLVGGLTAGAEKG
jgi:multiple sugar transport system permease protein